MWVPAAMLVFHRARTFKSHTASHSWSVTSNDALWKHVPALLTSTSTRPRPSIAASAHHLRDLGIIRDVGGDREELMARAPGFGGDRRVALLAASDDGDACAGFGEPERERLPETLVAPGDQRGRPLEAEW